MITTPLIKQGEKQPAHFSRRILGIALLAFALLSCFAFSAMSNEEEEAVGAFAQWLASPVVKFDTIGMELEFHQGLTKDALPYDSKLYTAATLLSGQDPFFKIVAETNKKTEVVTGVFHVNQEPDLVMMRDWIHVGRQLSLHTVGSFEPKADQKNAKGIQALGKQFDGLGDGIVAADPLEDPQGNQLVDYKGDPYRIDPITWNTKTSWSPQLTAQGPPEPHLKMISYACKLGDKVNQTPPVEANTPLLKLHWIIQEEMCRGVKNFLTDTGISETKESICFLPKATNIATILERPTGTAFSTWCLQKYPALAQKERSGPGFVQSNKFKYQETVDDLLKWADGTTKTATLGEPANFPQWTDTSIRIEYRRAENFWVLQDTITGGTIDTKKATGVDVVKALFQGCVPQKGSVTNVKTFCSVAT